MDFLCCNRWINVLLLVLRSINVIILITLISSASRLENVVNLTTFSYSN